MSDGSDAPSSNVVPFTDSKGTAEFDCVECGEHIVSFCHHGDARCAMCRHMPHWFMRPDLRRLFGYSEGNDAHLKQAMASMIDDTG